MLGLFLFLFLSLHVYFLALPAKFYESRASVSIIYHPVQNNLSHILGDQYIFGKGMRNKIYKVPTTMTFTKCLSASLHCLLLSLPLLLA